VESRKRVDWACVFLLLGTKVVEVLDRKVAERGAPLSVKIDFLEFSLHVIARGASTSL